MSLPRSPSRLTRRSLPASTFSHTPSKLSKSHSSLALAAEDPEPGEGLHVSDEDDSPAAESSAKASTAEGRLTKLNGRAPTTSSRTSPTAAQTPLSNGSSSHSQALQTPIRHRALAAATPTTPKLTYSPNATDVPPPSLSKSASIPFDMAASARAARTAQQDRSNGSNSNPAVGAGRKKRLIRKKPLLQRLASIPHDWIDKIAFHLPTSIEEVLPPARLANPIALGLHFFLCLILVPTFGRKDEPDSILRGDKQSSRISDRWDHVDEASRWTQGSFGGRTITLLVVVLLSTLAAGNSVYLFTRFRTYDMQLRSSKEPVHSPHVSPVAKPRAEATSETSNINSATGTKRFVTIAQNVGRVTWFLAKWVYKTILSIFGQSTAAPIMPAITGEDRMQSLRVWEPPEFCLAFFCAFPPSAPLLSYLLTVAHPFLTPLLHIVISFLLSHLAGSYAQLVKDRMILSAEVMREYDQRFVYKKVFSIRVDRGVQTNEAEQLW